LAGIGQTSTRYRALRLKAEAALEDLVVDPAVPPNVRAASARTLLELVGAIGSGRKREQDQDLNGSGLEPELLSLDDINREIGKLGEV
jgi:hypothetical protein